MGHAVVLLALLATGPLAYAGQHALLIGISDYARAGLTPLPGALTDVAMMRDVLHDRLGFRPEEIKVLTDEEATHAGIRRAFAGLAERVAPGDFVYIHYSGHGSLLADQSGEGERGGQDQTWVPYGARTSFAVGLNRYDILDDEINAWLAPIVGKASALVYVADACHSATNTRGEHALVARAAPSAAQADHPFARSKRESTTLANAVLIGSARDDESASEVAIDQGHDLAGAPTTDSSTKLQAGVFTYQWERAVREAQPGDTWRHLFDRTAIRIAAQHHLRQRPQLTGTAADRPVLGGEVSKQAVVPVAGVEGQAVSLKAGRLSGITIGSVFSTQDPADSVRVRITEAGAGWSKGTLEQGRLATGDFLVEREHAYETAPLRVATLPPESDGDALLLRRAFSRVTTLPGFVPATKDEEADLFVVVLRPLRSNGGLQHAVGASGRDSLPIQDPQAAPQLWVLDRGERLIHDDMAIDLGPESEAFATLAANLTRYRRLVELKRLASEDQAASDLGLAVIHFAPCKPGSTGCEPIDSDGHYVSRVPGTSAWTVLQRDSGLPKNTVASFELHNPGLRDRYAYLFELAPNGCINLIFPSRDLPRDIARLIGGQRLDLSQPPIETGVIMDTVGDASLVLLSTQMPIQAELLAQTCYRGSMSVVARWGMNPLEALLLSAVQGSGQRSAFTFSVGTWGGTVIDYRVVARDTPPSFSD
ncbi:caspase family protein [Thiorhodococcus minor]|nr:caspase family protein [Thiorhodococcus minor]